MDVLFYSGLARRELLVCSLILVFSINCAFGIDLESQLDGEDKSVIIGTSFFISQGGDVTIPGNLDVQYSNVLLNSGRLIFNNTAQSKIVLPSGDFGSGEFVFAGSNDYELNIPVSQARFGILKMDMPGGRVNLRGELAIAGNLNLNSGVVNVDKDGLLLIDNVLPESVSFNDSPVNKGYVAGFLTRKVSAGEKYIFPVGDVVSFHPFLIDRPEKDDVVSIAFDKSVPDEIHSYGPAQDAEIENSFGWRVHSYLDGQNTFRPGLSFHNTALEPLASQLEIYHLSEADLTASVTSGLSDASYLVGKDAKAYGLYAFNSLLDRKLVNFIYVGDGNITTLVVPDQGRYSNIRLSVFNQLGNVVFKSDHYSSEFDARNFPDGTYFYELVLEKENTQSIIRNFIDIQHGK